MCVQLLLEACDYGAGSWYQHYQARGGGLVLASVHISAPGPLGLGQGCRTGACTVALPALSAAQKTEVLGVLSRARSRYHCSFHVSQAEVSVAHYRLRAEMAIALDNGV